MRVYVASKFQNYAAVREAVCYIENAGHEITHDWTATDEFDAAGDPLAENEAELTDEQQRRYAAADFLGVKRCDALLVLAHPRMCGGMVEVGIALGLAKRIAVVEAERCPTIFYRLPGVSTHGTLPEALEALGLVEAAPC